MTEQTTREAPAEVVACRGPRAGTVNVEARRDGKICEAATFHAEHSQRRHDFARKAGVSDEAVQGAIRAALEADGHGPPAAGPAAPAAFSVALRGLHQRKADGQVYTLESPLAALQAALAVTDYPAGEPVIEWEGTAQLCVVDLDFHGLGLDQRPDARRLRALATLVRPSPALSWATHGRGLRLVYFAQGGFAADELAACATLGLRPLEPAATVETLAHTRHPSYARPGHPPAGPVMAGAETVELGALARWMGNEADETLVREWLAEQGLEMGARYPHERCPVAPQASSNRDPVLVGEAGITCFKCAASGLTLGGKPGFFPYAALTSGGVPSRLRRAARNFAHFEHTQHTLAEDVGVSGELARRCYSALLKAVHGPDDPRVGQALCRGRGLVRGDGHWVTADLCQAHAKDGLVDRLKVLPALQDRVGPPSQETLVLNRERLGLFRGVDDLSAFGYPRVQPVRGMKIFWHWRAGQDPRVVRAVVVPEHLREEALRPRYVPATKRMPIKEAERLVSESFPGVNLDYLKLLIAARGCAEGGAGQPPMIAVDGPTGSGKSGTVRIAAALIGDRHIDVPWSANLEHFQQGLLEASTNAGLVTSDEIIKLAAAKGDVLVGLNALLSFTQNSLIRKLYTGPVGVRQLPAIILTDIAFPRSLLCDEQLGRRLVHVHLDRRVDWQRSKDITRWRAQGPEQAAAANALVSDVIDRFFSAEAPLPFEDVARQLGFELLNQVGDTGLDPKADLLALYDACCGPGAAPAPATSWRGPGWKLIRRDGTDTLSKRWQAVCDNTGDGFVSSRRVKEADWARLLGLSEPVECDLSPNGMSTLAIRFRMGSARSKRLKVNEELKPPPVAPAPSPSPPPPEAPPAVPPAPAVPPTGCGSADGKTGAAALPSCPGPGVGAQGPPRGPVFIDIKTRSALHLRKEGGRRYAEHPTTQILTVAALVDDRLIAWAPPLDAPLPTQEMWPQGCGHDRLPIESFAGAGLPPPLAEAIASGRPLCAHNAHGFDGNAHGFDRLVWKAKGLLAPAEWQDALPHARAAGLPGELGALGQWLFGQGKDKQGEALLKRLSRPNHQGQFLPFNRQDAVRALRYCIADVLLLAQVHAVVYGLAEPDVLRADRGINERGVHFDDELARALIELEAHLAREVGAKIEERTGGAVRAADLRREGRLQKWLRPRGVALPDLKRETVQRRLQGSSPLDPLAREVLQARLAVNRVSTSKLEAALRAQCPDGRLRDLLTYHEAATGRWAGKGMQPHNLPRPHPDLEDLTALLGAVGDPQRFRAALPPTVTAADGIAALIRPTLRAGSGKRLCIADFGSIEARGVAWCAGEQALLARFAAGDDVYVRLAEGIFGRALTPQDGRERQIGKQATLACGYSMGARTFGQRCVALGIDLAAANTSAEAVVEGYRDAYPKIAGTKVSENGRSWRRGGLWKDVEAAARKCVLTGVRQSAGRCTFSREGTTLLVGLPGGRLHYRNARVESVAPACCREKGLAARPRPAVLFDRPRRRGVQAYGGLLVENIVQAITRDLLAAALVECERLGLPVVLHVHDEIVIEADEATAEEALRRLALVMSTPPAWAVGFPIEVKGFVAERYAKDPPPGAPAVKARNGEIVG
jgi:DNA polymerase